MHSCLTLWTLVGRTWKTHLESHISLTQILGWSYILKPSWWNTRNTLVVVYFVNTNTQLALPGWWTTKNILAVVYFINPSMKVWRGSFLVYYSIKFLNTNLSRVRVGRWVFQVENKLLRCGEGEKGNVLIYFLNGFPKMNLDNTMMRRWVFFMK